MKGTLNKMAVTLVGEDFRALDFPNVEGNEFDLIVGEGGVERGQEFR